MAIAAVKPRAYAATPAAPTFTGARCGYVFSLGQ
jgi:hypothetical protein